MSAEASSSLPSRPTYACIRCANRKVKCDRQRPCSACVKHNVDCVFHPPPPPRKRHKRPKADHALNDRLRHYEALLKERGIDPQKITPEQSHSATTSDTQQLTPSSIDSDPNPNRALSKSQLVHGQGRTQAIDNTLWTRVVEEFPDPEDALEHSSSDAEDFDTSEDDHDYVLNNQPTPKARSRHPPPERIHQLWQIFVENFDPVTKVVHVPSLRPAIQKAASDTEKTPRQFEALMFAIYSAAVVSLNEKDCEQMLGEARRPLLLRYISATKAALSRARFLGTTSLVVLQALVLHILTVRDIYEPRVVWSLTGVATRIAQSMGMERDGSFTDLPPFEAEMRRRVWWLLRTHDFRTAELCGLPKFRDLDVSPEKTKTPTNVNDNQLYPGMTSPPVETTAMTDNIFIAVRYDLMNFAAARIARFREQGKNSSQWDMAITGPDGDEIGKAVEETEEMLETKYIRYCDPSQPLQLMTLLAARSSINQIRFLTHHPRRWPSLEQIPPAERELVWKSSLKHLEQHNMGQSTQSLKQFAWHALYFLQWQPFIHVLDTLRADPLTPDAERAWAVVGGIYKHNPRMALDRRKPIHVAVGNLCLKAYAGRENALMAQNLYVPPKPDFIIQLEEQRELTKAKTRERDSAKLLHSAVNITATHQLRGFEPNPSIISVTGPDIPQPQQGITQPTSADADSFWLMNGLDDNQFGNFNDMMDVDLDFNLGQDFNVNDGNATPAINWEQWDAWLADSNLMRPL